MLFFMNSLLEAVNFLDMSLESIVYLKDLITENLPLNFLERCDFYALDTHGLEIRKFTGEPYSTHINEVQAFGEFIAQDNLQKFIGRQFKLHDYGEDVKKNKDKLNGDNSYIEYSPLFSEFRSNPVSLFLAQNVRLMDKRVIETHLISNGILEENLDKEEKYRRIVMALMGDYGFPLVLGRIPDAKLSSIILVPNKIADMISNMDAEKSPNKDFFIKRYNSSSNNQLKRDINRNYLDGVVSYVELMERSF